MKVRLTTYSFTFCIISAAFLLLYLDLRVLPANQKSSLPRELQGYNADKATFYQENNQPEQKDYSPKPIPLKLQSRQNLKKGEQTTTISPVYNHTTTQPAPLSTAHIIAVISYMRSGSSLTADILQHFQGTVYVFEPLHTVTRRAIEGKPLVYLNGRKIWLKPENLTDEFIREELHKWFQCRYGDLDIFSLVDNFHYQFSRSMRTLIQCWKIKHRTVKAMRQCLPDAIKMCQNAKQRLFKFIRLPVRIIQSVFNVYPNLQIVHLIRDPRGSLTSQIKVNKSKWEDVSTTSKAHCDQVAEDINITTELYHHDNQRARILLYENLASDPVNTAIRIYKYTGMPVMKYVTDYVRKLTLDGRRRSCLFCIVSGNSTETANAWRDVIRYDDMVTIDNSCHVTYEVMGYQSFRTETELRDHFLETHLTPNMSIII